LDVSNFVRPSSFQMVIRASSVGILMRTSESVPEI
jgi:hypothetical protein